MECLDNIIGLSQTTCECWEDGKPLDYNESKSGLFLDELDGLSLEHLNSASGCENGGIWDLMTKSIQEAELSFRQQILSIINTKFLSAYKGFNGFVGQRSFNGTVTNKALSGVTIKPHKVDGGVILIKQIDAYFNETTTDEITVNVYQKYIDAPLHTFTIDTVANAVKNNVLDTPIRLEATVDNYNDVEYYLVYEKHATAKPLNNKFLNCSCTKGKEPWDEMATICGLNTDVLDYNSVINCESRMFGLGLILEIDCEKSTVICGDKNELDFINDSVALNIAFSIRYLAGINLVHKLLSRPDSSLVALNEDQLLMLIVEYSEKVELSLNYIKSNVEPSNGCYLCKSNVSVGSIIK